MARAPREPRPRRPVGVRLAIWVFAALAIAGAGYGAVVYTEQPAFCRVCHEMQPYHDAWAAGPHTDVSCITCHVAPGLVNRMAHKFVALKEVWDHFTTDPRFPMMTADVPNARCTTCHPEIPAQSNEPFAHKLHVEQPMLCLQCHADTGHRVTYAALDAAGILAADGQPAGATYVGQVILGSESGTTLAGHAEVKCSNCHDMAAAECQTCHRPPPNHFVGQCARCHAANVPFASAVFEHPAVSEEHTYRSFPCAYCHPKSYGVAVCTRCHEGGAPQDDD